jgi:hypothetical protein
MSSLHLKSASIAAFVIALIPLTASAREHSTTVYGRRGGIYGRNVTHSPGYTSVNESAQLPNGKTATRTLTTEKTDTGRTTTAQATGFNGKTATFNSTRTNTAEGYTRQVTATGSNGASLSKQIDVSRENGTVSRNVTETITPHL